MSVRNFSLSPVPSTRRVSSPKQVVFCDFDGPIVDVSERYYQTYRKGLLAIGELYRQQSGQILYLQPLSKDQFWQMKQNRTADLEIAACSGISTDLFAPFMQQVAKIVNHPSLLSWDCMQPTAQAALDHFRRCNMRLVLVTLRHPRQVQSFLQAQGLEDLVDEVHGVFDIKAAHANRVEQKCELLASAIAQQQTQGHLTQGSWMVGDTEADILAGQSMGLSTAALSCGVRSTQYLQRFAPSGIYDCLMTAAREVVSDSLPQAA